MFKVDIIRSNLLFFMSKTLMPFNNDDSFRSLISQFFEDRWPSLNVEMSVGTPKVNIAENDTEVEITADLPGMRAEDVNIEIHDGVLLLSGEHSTESKDEDKKKKYYRYERSYGSFARSFVLPSAVDEDAIEANMKDGVLSVKLPKIKQEKRKIEVKKK